MTAKLQFSDETLDWDTVILVITNKMLTVKWKWSERTKSVPISYVRSVQTKKGGWFSNHELVISPVGVFRSNDYNELVCIANHIKSLL